MFEHGISRTDPLETSGLRSCSAMVIWVPISGTFALAHLAGAVPTLELLEKEDGDDDPLTSTLNDLVKSQVMPVIKAVVKENERFYIHLGHGYSRSDGITLMLVKWFTTYASEVNLHATYIQSPTCRAYARKDQPFGSTHVSITPTGR